MSTDMEVKSSNSEAVQSAQEPAAASQTYAQAGEQADSGLHTQSPALTLKEAAAILGKSLRALERSILGRWGNKLPDGWTARKLQTPEGSQWRIIPPPGFAIKNLSADQDTEMPADELFGDEMNSSPKFKLAWAAGKQTIDNQTIVIDRSDEVERLLRELLQTQKQLSEERRLRLEDLRLIGQMHDSMRLLEDRASQTSRLKEELDAAAKEFLQLKEQYLQVLNQPWWKQLFSRSRR